MIEFYRQVDKTISEKVQSEAWGQGVVSELARYITQTDPGKNYEFWPSFSK